MSFTFYKYCLSPEDMIYKIVKSHYSSIATQSIHDFVPAIIKSKKFYKELRIKKFIKCSNRSNLIGQIIEVNYLLYNKYFPFYKRHIKIGNNILHLYKSYIKIGVHVRMNDKCLKSCIVNVENIHRIMNISKKYCQTKFIVLLSSFDRSFNKLFYALYKNVYSYNITSEIKHSAKSLNITQYDIDKTILDMLLTSNSDILLLNGLSTYSLFILYKGYYSNYNMCKPKPFKFWNNGEVFDHLDRFRRKGYCKNITI